jgi:hypothetical protein
MSTGKRNQQAQLAQEKAQQIGSIDHRKKHNKQAELAQAKSATRYNTTKSWLEFTKEDPVQIGKISTGSNTTNGQN